MIFSTVNKIPAFLLDKLSTLFHLLIERKAEYETFADKIDDKHLQRTVLTLAQETNQYAMELSSQIEMMGGAEKVVSNIRNTEHREFLVPEQGDILRSCEVSEGKMINAYRTILNEPFLHENLRKLIRCQLNGLTYAFMQLRLLNTSLTHRAHN